MKSKSKECICPACGTISQKHHGTYHLRVQDLPILRKSGWLDITAYEFQCKNPDCSNVSNIETFQGCLRYRRQMTDCCAFFIHALVLETSCEATADICKAMGVKNLFNTAFPKLPVPPVISKTLSANILICLTPNS